MARAPNKLSWQDWGHLLTVAALVTGVGGTLLLGAVLRAGPDTPPVALDVVSSSPASPAPWEVRRLDTPATEVPAEGPPADYPPADPTDPQLDAEEPPAPEADVPEAFDDLPGHEEPPAPRWNPAPPVALLPPPADTAGGDWTLQFMVTCSDETAARIESSLGADPRLQILPVQVDGRDCRRICWGSYATREAALAREGLPAALTAVNREPIPRKVADLLR